MHELAIAQDIVKQVEDEARRHGVSEVKALHVRMGSRAFASRDSLEFCLRASSEGTVAEDARLCIEEAGQGGIVLDSIEIEE